LGSQRYYDLGAASSFSVKYEEQEAYAVLPHNVHSQRLPLLKSIRQSMSAHASEHFPSGVIGVYPCEKDTAVAIVLASNKYSPQNFWNGRWRSQYIYSPANSNLTGSIRIDVHYYEDGNVRLLTEKPISVSLSSSAGPEEIVRHIALLERKYQEEVNRTFSTLSEGAFKGLRRQLPITRQKIDWEKISSYRLGQDIGGGRSK
ncbi:MAG: F-actin-capping protein subunit alpha, partial [Thelocarpon superellum]